MPPTSMPDIVAQLTKDKHKSKTYKPSKKWLWKDNQECRSNHIFCRQKSSISELSVVNMLHTIEGLEAYRKHHEGLLGVGAES
jgi:hypothetical protein